MLLNIYRHDASSASSQGAQRNQPFQWVIYAIDKVCRPTRQSIKFLRFFAPRKKQHFSYFEL